MTHAKLFFGLASAAALAVVAFDSSEASALTRTCSSGSVAFPKVAACKHPINGKDVARGGLGGANNLPGDRYLVALAGRNGGMPANVKITQVNFLTFDSSGARTLDCQVSSSDPDGVFVNFFGLSEPPCDRSVSTRISAAFEDR